MNPARLIAETVEESIDAKIEKASRGGQKTVTAVYCGKDADGKPYVQILGADDTTPIRRMSVQADIGDTVTVTIENGMAVVDSNVSNPSASASNLQAVEVKASKAQQTADEAVEKVARIERKTEAAMTQALEASNIAAEAQQVADATNQHFWDDDNGAHVTDVTQEEWTAAVEDNFSDLSTNKPYHNSLFNSLGMLFRSALNNLVAITRSAIAFYDGNGNQSDNIVASFGSSGAQIGKAAEGHAALASNELKFMYDDYTAVSISSKNDSGIAGESNGRIKLDGGNINIVGNHDDEIDDVPINTLSLTANGGNSRYGSIYALARGIDGRGEITILDSDVRFTSIGTSSQNYQNIDAHIYPDSIVIESYGHSTEPTDNEVLTIGHMGNVTLGTPLGASSGGTGETSLKSSANALMGALDAVSSTDATDNTDFITSASNGGTTTFYRRNALFVWNWIKGKIDSVYGLGTVVTGSDTVASVANTTATQICSVSLAPGTWVVTYTASFASNATGRRNIKLYAGTSTTIDPARSATCQAVNGSATVLSRTAVVTVSSTTSYYLNAYQASGGALSVDGDIQAIRIA